MYNNIPTKVLTGEVRMSYCHLTTPYAATMGGEPKYSAALLIPKTDANTKADIDRSIQAAVDQGTAKTWNGSKPPMIRMPIYDGDGVRPSGVAFGPECKGHWVVTASSKQQPEVVGISNVNCQLSPSDIYSGMYARVTINFFAYRASGNTGIGCGLGNVLKTRDGDPLGGGHSTAANDFAGLEAQEAIPGYPPISPAAVNVPQAQRFNPLTGMWE